MPAQSSSIDFVLNWAKERIDEMDATLASLERQVAEIRDESRARAEQFIADLRQKRDEFNNMFEKQSEAGKGALEAIEARLETLWRGFETEINKFLEAYGPDIKEQQAVFKSQVTAQINAWRETADKIHAAAAEFAAGRWNDIDTVVSRMRADATAAEEKLQQLARAGTGSWSALNAALTETRAAFDRANQAAREAFKRASGSAQ